MVDISLCHGGKCPRKNDCFRFRALPDPRRQSYMDFPGMDGLSDCDDFKPLDRAISKLRDSTKSLDNQGDRS